MRENDGGSAVSVYFAEIVHGTMAQFLTDCSIQRLSHLVVSRALSLHGDSRMDWLTLLGLSQSCDSW